MFDNVGPWTCTRVSCYAPRVHGFWMITVHGFGLGVITFLELAHMLDATQQCRPLNLHAQYVSLFCAKALLAPPSHARGWMFRWSVWSEVRGPSSYIQVVRSTRCEVRSTRSEVWGPRCGVCGPRLYGADVTILKFDLQTSSCCNLSPRWTSTPILLDWWDGSFCKCFWGKDT